MVFMYGMCVGVRGFATALEIFATDQTAIDVDIRQTNAAELLKVKIERSTIDLFQ